MEKVKIFVENFEDFMDKRVKEREIEELLLSNLSYYGSNVRDIFWSLEEDGNEEEMEQIKEDVIECIQNLEEEIEKAEEIEEYFYNLYNNLLDVEIEEIEIENGLDIDKIERNIKHYKNELEMWVDELNKLL